MPGPLPLSPDADYNRLAAAHNELLHALNSPPGAHGVVETVSHTSPVGAPLLSPSRIPLPASPGGVCGCPVETHFSLAGALEPVSPSGSNHAFQSNTPAHENEGMVHRTVDYITEMVTVPVQRPLVHERIHRTREIPTEHVIEVRNVPCCNATAVCSNVCSCC
eukprot:NODE_1588_length_802_cov_155.136296_g1539_i0.p1 GENE.NODE_1588_length_802_cov_155.136296_g1539_i0~~NODE_1588_length_802_cov_155.136296_g1539_i0.p1  ORF type:complete len:163 (+),score=13.30 NODE_1588_length_802_cov_155.136296_g1539_i0:85-573(+)